MLIDQDDVNFKFIQIKVNILIYEWHFLGLQIFDLKGSMRNRLVSTSGKRVEDLVLLDENLLKCKPLSLLMSNQRDTDSVEFSLWIIEYMKALSCGLIQFSVLYVHCEKKLCTMMNF